MPANGAEPDTYTIDDTIRVPVLRGGKALVLERVAVVGLVAVAPGRVTRAIAPPESDTEPASAWKESSAKFVSDISYNAVAVGEKRTCD